MEFDKAKTAEERKKLYLKYVESKTPKASWVKSLLHAFLVGGGICVFGQMLGDVLRSLFPKYFSTSSATC